jgi:hypothetical protein
MLSQVNLGSAQNPVAEPSFFRSVGLLFKP